MQDFKSLNLPKNLMVALDKMSFNTPTPIQAESIPHALEGKDILGSAQTGTGKTGAFGIPLVSHLLSNPRGTAIVMTPTRELAVQVMAALKQMLSESPQIKTAVLIGGEPMGKQFNQLKMRPRLIVGTPGRINDHLERGTVQLNEANFLVLDETDRMLDMGFGVQIDRVLKFMPKQRQTLMFSATLPRYIIKMADQYMNSPVRVSAGEVSSPVLKISQETVKVQNNDKYTKLTEELAKRSGSVIVFVKSKHGCDKLAYRLSKDDHEAEAIHGDLRQNKRDKVIKSFREGRYRVLVATDIAARGLDIPHIEHVINFDLPQVAEDYIHRIGRTGRNGAEGQALNFVSGEDGAKWKAIQRLLNPGEKIESDEAPQGYRSGGGGNRSRSGSGHRGQGGGNSSPYAKKRPFGSRADGSSDRNQGGGGYRQNREDRPARSNESRSFEGRSFEGRPAAPRAEGFQGKERNKDFGDFRDSNGDRNGNREGGNRSRFEAPRHEGARNDRPRFEGNRSNGPRSEGNRSDKPRFEGRRDSAPRSDRPAGDRPRGDRPQGQRDGNRPSHSDSRPQGQGYQGAPKKRREDGEKPRGDSGYRSAPRAEKSENSGDKPRFFGRSRAA